jgi:uncharacterized protein
MMPVVRRFVDVESFLGATAPFLESNEAVNSLILGLTQRLKRQVQPRRRGEVFLATVGRGEEPSLVAVMMPQRKMLIAGRRDQDVINALAGHLAQSQTPVPSVFGPSELSSTFATNWMELTGSQGTAGVSQRLYKADKVILPGDIPGGTLNVASEKSRDVLSHWVKDFYLEALPDEAGDIDTARIIVDRLLIDNDLFVWDISNNESPQPTCMAARARPTAHGIAINLVFTPQEQRGKGFASALVARLTELLLNSGWQFCTLFTDRSNRTSNHIYQTIGYEPIADFDEFRFDV